MEREKEYKREQDETNNRVEKHTHKQKDKLPLRIDTSRLAISIQMDRFF